MRRAIPFSFLLFCAASVLAQEEAVPLLDVEAILPDDEMVPFEIEEPKIDEGIELAERAISASEQFSVTGGEKGQRGSLALESEEIRLGFHQLLGLENPPVVVPIEIILHGKVGDEPRKRPLAYQLRYTKDIFLLEIHVDLSRGIDRDRMERAILSGLLYQRRKSTASFPTQPLLGFGSCSLSAISQR